MLGYCTNVHSGTSFDDVIRNVNTHAYAVRKNFKQPLGVGLWLSNDAVIEADIPLLKDTIQQYELDVFTMNGFPFSNFHDDVVQHQVYKPNWCSEQRLEYTIKLATILAAVTSQTEAGISTLPLGWNSDNFTNDDAAKMLMRCLDILEDLEQQTSVCIHIDIETEPGCRLQRASELAIFMNQYFGDNERSRRYIRVCHDTCHAAIMHETAEECVMHYQSAGLSIGKVQLSSAIEIDFQNVNTVDAIADLQNIIEPRYLHQTTILSETGMDCFDNLQDAPFHKPTGLWRVHFHVPIHEQNFGTLSTTQQNLIDSIQVLKRAGVSQWEVETYTWDVMPASFKDDNLVESITKELTWATMQLHQ